MIIKLGTDLICSTLDAGFNVICIRPVPNLYYNLHSMTACRERNMVMPMRLISVISLVLLISLLGWIQPSYSASGPIMQAAETISGTEMRTYIGPLASEEFQGRLTGQPGQMKAAELVAQAFAEFGLIPLGDDRGFFQHFTTPTNVVTGEPIVELLLDGNVISYQIGEQYLFRGETGSGDVTAPICFVGYGITDEKLKYDDYSGIDATGKWALSLRGWHPAFPESSFDWAKTGYKVRNAYKHGAVGLILVGARANGTVETPTASCLYGLPVEEMHPDFPMVHVGKDFALDLFGSCGWYLPGIVEMINKGKPQPFDFPAGIKAHVKVEADFKPDAVTANVIGFLPGADPELAKHAVVVCAHHDHVGYQPGIMFPGADDNASGTVALLAIARAASRCAEHPARSLVFISFTGEEEGLLGSQYFVDNPAWPLKNIDYVINLDMIGQGTTINLWGGKAFPDLLKLFDKLAGEYDIKVEAFPAYPVSDHGPFVDKGIEGVMLIGGGEKEYPSLAHHPYVYKPEMINTKFLEAVARIAFRAAFELAGE